MKATSFTQWQYHENWGGPGWSDGQFSQAAEAQALRQGINNLAPANRSANNTRRAMEVAAKTREKILDDWNNFQNRP
jgi:hypothetical protein